MHQKGKDKIPKNLNNKSKHKNNKCFSWVTAVRVLSLSGSHSPPHFSQHCANLWTCCGGSSDSNPVLLLCVLASNVHSYQNYVFSFVGALNDLFIFHRHRVCLVDHVDLICSLYSWWEAFGSSSLATLPLSFNCGLFPPLHVGHPLGFAPVAALEDLGLPLWRPDGEMVQLLGSQRLWQHQVLRGIGG